MTDSDFKPAWWLRSPHLQTLWPVFFKKRHKLDLINEQLELEDGDFIDLCWSKKASDKSVLVLHGLEGDIQKAITYYEDPHELVGKSDFVMANPPFNVDEIDADKVKTDPRLPFGLPSVNKKGKVSNGNYVWISYFYCLYSL